MGPTSSFDDLSVGVEVVKDGVSVGDQRALVSVEQRIDGSGIVLWRIAEEHVPLWRRDDEEVRVTTFLLLLHQHAGRVDAEVGRHEGVLPHRLQQRLHQVRELQVPVANRRAGEVEALATEPPLQSVQRKVVFPAVHDGVGQQARPGEPALDGQLQRRPLVYLGLHLQALRNAVWVAEPTPPPSSCF